jgi:hypothetical protein
MTCEGSNVDVLSGSCIMRDICAGQQTYGQPTPHHVACACFCAEQFVQPCLSQARADAAPLKAWLRPAMPAGRAFSVSNVFVCDASVGGDDS